MTTRKRNRGQIILPNRNNTNKPELLDGEEFRQLIFYNIPIFWYTVSNYGRLFSHRKKMCKGTGGGKGTKLVYDPNYWLENIWSKEIVIKRYKDGTTRKKLNSLYKKLTLPKGFFDGSLIEGYDYHSSSAETFNKRINIHQAIMWTFRPWQDFPPEGIDPKDCQNLPSSVLQYCIMAATINHKNHLPDEDNYVCLDDMSKDKIEYVTPNQNTQKAITHYGGSTENAPDVYLNEQKKEDTIMSPQPSIIKSFLI